MTSQAPIALRVDPGVLTVLEGLLRAVAPEEGCALLIGQRGKEPSTPTSAGGSVWRLERVWPCLNCWPRRQERRRRFALDPREQLLAQRWARTRGLGVLGAAHSHPDGPARPSPTDQALTLAPALMVILGRDGAAAWWLEEGDPQPRPLPWRMED